MKTTFKKEFDRMEEDFPLDETTINEDLNIDSAVIKENVMGQIDIKKHKKNRSRLTVFLVAAAVSASVVGTSAFAANQIIQRNNAAHFEKKFKGDTSIVQVANNEEVKFSSTNDNINAELSGTISDGERTIISVTLTNKDGTPFFPDADGILKPEGIFLSEIKPYSYWNGLKDKDYISELKKLEDKPDYQYVFFIQSEDGSIMQEDNTVVSYSLSEDRSTLNVFFDFSTEYNENNGGILCLTSNYINTYKNKELIASYDEMNDDNYFAASKLCEEKGIDFYKDCKWDFSDNKFSLYQIEIKRNDISFDVKQELIFAANNSIKTVVTDRTAPNLVKKDRLIDAKITPFKITLNAEAIYTPEEYNNILSSEMKKNNWEDESIEAYIKEPHTEAYEPDITLYTPLIHDDNHEIGINDKNSKVIMKDGKEYYFIDVSSSIGESEDELGNKHFTDDITLSYSDIPFNNDFGFDVIEDMDKISVIDTTKINKVIINGETIYDSEKAAASLTKMDVVKADMTKYEPVARNGRELKTLLIDSGCNLISYEQYESLSIQDEKGLFKQNRFEFRFSATEEDTKQLISMIDQLREKNYFILEAAVSKSKDQNGQHQVNVIMNNYYPDKRIDDAYAKDYILTMYTVDDWSKEFEEFFEEGSSENVSPLSISENDPNYEFFLNPYERKNKLSVTLDSNNAPAVVSKDCKADLVVTPFKIVISSKREYDKAPDDNADWNLMTGLVNASRLDYKNSKVIMKDGSEHFFILISPNVQCHVSDGEDYSEIQAKFTATYCSSYYPDNDTIYTSTKRIGSAETIDVKQIKSIVLNGNEVYTAE